jgi:hypothetical protein
MTHLLAKLSGFVLLGIALPSCACSEVKGAVSAYAQAIDHVATSSKKLLQECVTPPAGLSEEDRKAECEAAEAGFDTIQKSAVVLAKSVGAEQTK